MGAYLSRFQYQEIKLDIEHIASLFDNAFGLDPDASSSFMERGVSRAIVSKSRPGSNQELS